MTTFLIRKVKYIYNPHQAPPGRCGPSTSARAVVGFKMRPLACAQNALWVRFSATCHLATAAVSSPSALGAGPAGDLHVWATGRPSSGPPCADASARSPCFLLWHARRPVDGGGEGQVGRDVLQRRHDHGDAPRCRKHQLCPGREEALEPPKRRPLAW